MRRCVIVAMLLAAMATSQVRVDRPNKREVRELVAKYLSKDTEEVDRAAALKRLQEGTPALAATPLRYALRDDDTRARALTLATELRVEGLWSTASTFIDGDDEDFIIKYGMVLQERGASEEVFDRWKDAEVASTKYAIANGALRAYPVDTAVVRKVKDFLDRDAEDDRKAKDAAEILRYQLALPDASVEEISDNWSELMAQFSLDRRGFRLAGTDLFQDSKWEEVGTVFHVGKNYRLAPGAWMKCAAPSEWNDGDRTFVVRVRVVEGTGVAVGLGTAQGMWTVELKDRQWVVRSGREIEVLRGSRAWPLDHDQVRRELYQAGERAGRETLQRLCGRYEGAGQRVAQRGLPAIHGAGGEGHCRRRRCGSQSSLTGASHAGGNATSAAERRAPGQVDRLQPRPEPVGGPPAPRHRFTVF